MSRSITLPRRLLLACVGVLLITTSAGSQPGVQPPPPQGKPNLQPVAETKLLMEGLANANFRGLEKILKAEPANDQSWTFARGQALLIAETGNLLMMRPPKGEAQPVWFNRAMSLRTAATQLAGAIASKDYAKSKALLGTLSKTCNGCHQSFSVPIQIIPFAQQGGQIMDVNLISPH